jgi:glyoxylase-like metal-dependent hydrolase (beta-lactamase superfamily II)
LHRTAHPLLGNAQALDGGSMFGNCPRAVWERWLPPDDHGRVVLACRCLLVEERPAPGAPVARRVLLETGIGAFFAPTLRERYGVLSARHELLDALAARGLAPGDIDVVVLSHLHFDHAGGLLAAFQEGAPARLVFPRAAFVVGRRALARARAPHARDRASFIDGLPDLLEASGRLAPVEAPASDVLGAGWRLRESDGHTPGLLLVEVDLHDGPVLFVSDLVPGAPWVHVPITMGYDRFPELVVDEKAAVLADVHARGVRLVFTHDPHVAMARVVKDERGRYRAEPVDA